MKVPVVFLTGFPASGKGTQCALLLEHYRGAAYFSVGDLLRAEAAKDTERGHRVNELITTGRIVPPEISVALMAQRMGELGQDMPLILVDGFPRSLEQLEAYHAQLGTPALVLDFEVPEAVVRQRVATRVAEMRARGEEPRSDDKPEVVDKRIAVYHEQIAPVIEAYRREHGSILHRIDCDRPKETVFEDVKALIDSVLK